MDKLKEIEKVYSEYRGLFRSAPSALYEIGNILKWEVKEVSNFRVVELATNKVVLEVETAEIATKIK